MATVYSFKADARNVSFVILYGGQFTLSTQLMKPNYFTYQIHDKCENIIKQKGILDNQIHDKFENILKKLKKKGNSSGGTNNSGFGGRFKREETTLFSAITSF